MGQGTRKDVKAFKENPFNQSENNRKLLRARASKRKIPSGQRQVDKVKDECKKLNHTLAATFQRFEDFPLSPATQRALQEAAFEKPTDIQRDSLSWSLCGSDVVGSAKTGSGKTLALIIPVLENLWKAQWTKADGLGALIIAPTRELAFQIFEVLNVVGKYHQFSAGLLIGGTDVQFQMQRLSAMNIIVCTPGRLLQHLEENYSFKCEQLQMLVIDEADRILDMGFRQQIDSIMEYLPSERQTLLFSATQTRRVEDLARVSVHDAATVNVHEFSLHATPSELQQSYMVCEEHEKLNMLWSFLVNNKRSKILIFVSCCKQARFITESFRHLRPGLTFSGLWGTQKQTKRLEILQNFDDKKKGAALVATDVASRGLDFQNLDWVLQLDCPNSVEDYIHRVGRTARMNRKGQAVLVLSPSQLSFVESLRSRNLPISQISPDERKVVNIRPKLMSVIASFPNLKEFAQGSIVAYAKSFYFAKDKSVFDVTKLNFEALAQSYGLVSAPRIRFLKKKGIQLPSAATESESDTPKKGLLQDVLKKIREPEKDVEEQEVELTSGQIEALDVGGSLEDVFTVKKRNVFDINDAEEKEEKLKPCKVTSQKVITREGAAKKLLKKGIAINKRVVFGEDGVSNDQLELKPEGFDFEEAKRAMEATDAADKKRHRDFIRNLKREKRLKKERKKLNEDDVDLGESEGEEPDLSWLPDPDKKYDSDADDSQDSADDGPIVSRKRKLRSTQNDEEMVLKLMKF